MYKAPTCKQATEITLKVEFIKTYFFIHNTSGE